MAVRGATASMLARDMVFCMDTTCKYCRMIEKSLEETHIEPMTDLQAAWLAGLFEGEGWITHTRNGKIATRWQVGISMTDQDVIERVLEITGCGHITDHDRGKVLPGRKTVYRWCVSSKAEMIFIINSILPLLSSRRRSRALEALASIHETRCKRHRPESEVTVA